jgi:uncharacterized RDD family membrane protein YckC
MASIDRSPRPPPAATGDEGDYEVLTPERVSLQYDLAGVGSRGVAITIDTAIQLLVVAGIVGLGVAGVAATGVSSSIAVAVLVVLVFAVAIGYFMLWEIVWNGQTPGKRVLHLRVLRETGYPIRAGDSVIRNVVRIVDAMPFGYVLGLVTMLLNDRSKRLGDFAAGTIVVREGVSRRDGWLGATADEPVVRMSLGDATLVRDFLARRDGLEHRRRAALAARLAQTLATAYGLDSLRGAAASDEDFLERLV